MGEQLPLATLHDAVLESLRDRSDAVLQGAQAVNAYVGTPRMTQGVDLLSTRAAGLAEDIRSNLHSRFNIAARTREGPSGLAYRVYQLRKPENRHLVDIREVGSLPPALRIEGVLVLSPVELICAKLLSIASRGRSPKGFTDQADLRRLLLKFPDLHRWESPVLPAIRAQGAAPAVEKALDLWREIASESIEPEGDEG